MHPLNFKRERLDLLLKNKDGNTAGINLTGATLTNLVLGDEEVIKYPLKKDDPHKGYPSAFLFPFPNRIKDGRYIFEEKEYDLERNDAEMNNAIHGLIAFSRFEVISSSENKATLTMSYLGENAGYPFPFKFTAHYVLKKDKLELTIEAENTGDSNMPCAFGWHPYFGFQGSAIGEMTVKAPRRQKMELSDRYIPTGEFETERAGLIPLKNTILDNVFKLDSPSLISEVEVRYKKKKLIVSQKTGKNKLNYMVLYTPASRDCIAIEPQSANTNSFNNGEGLNILKPGKKVKYEISVRVES